MEKLALYDIADAFSKLDELAESNEDLVPYLDSVEMQMKDKVSNIVRFTRSLELTGAALDSEIERLSELKKSYLRKSDNLKSYLSYSMLKNGIEKVDTDIAKLSFRKSKSVEIEDISKLPKKYIVEKVSLAPDKKAIKEAIEQGEQVSGATIKESNNLQIK